MEQDHNSSYSRRNWAPPLPFWLITLGAVVACLLLWWGDRGLQAGVVRHLAVVHRHVEVHPHQHAFPADVEIAAFNSAVTDWERVRGFERL